MLSARLLFGLLVAACPVAALAAPPVTFEDRLAAQTVVEQVRYGHLTGARRPFGEVFTPEVIESRVRTYLEESAALERLWGTPVDATMLEREMRRIARASRMPERIEAIYAALGNDPVLVQECFLRPIVVGRLVRSFYARDARLHADARATAEALRQGLLDGSVDPHVDRPDRTVFTMASDPFDASDGTTAVSGASGPEGFRTRLPAVEASAGWSEVPPEPQGAIGPVEETDDAFRVRVVLEQDADRFVVASYGVTKRPWDAWWAEAGPSFMTDDVRSVARAESVLLRPATVVRTDSAAATNPPLDDVWDNGSLGLAPTGRFNDAAVWTGAEMLVWGGNGPQGLRSDGYRYDPAIDTWSRMSATGAPAPRLQFTAVWSGSEMIVWGGIGTGELNTGARYDPMTDTWRPTQQTGAPSPRRFHTAVWTGDRMIVWGGVTGASTSPASGGIYDPVSDSWTPTATFNAPTARQWHTAVWTGTEMMVWGGRSGTSSVALATGALYNPATDAWRTTSTTGAPRGRYQHTAVWTGHQVIVWGGDGGAFNTGGRFDPLTNSWQPISEVGASHATIGHSAVWTGDAMLLWGGSFLSSTGTRYDPVQDRWSPITNENAPQGRGEHHAFWTGSLMLVWGGNNAAAALATGGRYDPTSDRWTPMSTAGNPPARAGHAAVWTGTDMVIWGGRAPDPSSTETVFPVTGFRYDPAVDAWRAIASTGAPSGRGRPGAIWTGDEMIVWGGERGGFVADGGRYDPALDTWAPMPTLGSPPNALIHNLIWTGSEAIAWGRDAQNQEKRGGLYDPASDTWRPMSSDGAPGEIVGSGTYPSGMLAWTGRELLVWGWDGQSATPEGKRYDPRRDAWSPMSNDGAPSHRLGEAAVWTGREFIIWGGNTVCCGSTPTATGGRYDPRTDRWRPMSTDSAPTPRANHAAVWTGRRMIVWGGSDASLTTSGGRYDPKTDSWAPISQIDAPAARSGFSAVWVGDQMIVWGGDSAGSNGGRYFLAQSNQPPIADAGADTTTECASFEGSPVTLDAARTTDDDSTPGTRDDIVSYEWFEDFGGPSERVLSEEETFTLALPRGPHTLTLRVTDYMGATATDTRAAGVVDTVPPVLSVSAEPNLLWPPNHTLVPVLLQTQVSDVCDPSPVVHLEQAASNEPDDAPGHSDGATTGDLVLEDVEAGAQAMVRAERDGRGAGRVYTFGYVASDAAGNRSTTAATVTVPHDQGSSVEPLLMHLEPVGTSGRTRIEWSAVPGALAYDVIAADRAKVRQAGGTLSLGPVEVLARGLTTPGLLDDGSADLAPGECRLYFIQQRTGSGGSGYGTESAPWPRLPESCAGGCP